MKKDKGRDEKDRVMIIDDDEEDELALKPSRRDGERGRDILKGMGGKMDKKGLESQFQRNPYMLGLGNGRKKKGGIAKETDVMDRFATTIGEDGIARNRDGRVLIGRGSKGIEGSRNAGQRKIRTSLPSPSSTFSNSTTPRNDPGVPTPLFLKVFEILHKNFMRRYYNYPILPSSMLVGLSEDVSFTSVRSNIVRLMKVMKEVQDEMDAREKWSAEALLEAGNRMGWMIRVEVLMGSYLELRKLVKMAGTMDRFEGVGPPLKLHLDPKRIVLNLWRAVDKLSMSWWSWTNSGYVWSEYQGIWNSTPHCHDVLDGKMMDLYVWFKRAATGQESEIKMLKRAEIGGRDARIKPPAREMWRIGFEDVIMDENVRTVRERLRSEGGREGQGGLMARGEKEREGAHQRG